MPKQIATEHDFIAIGTFDSDPKLKKLSEQFKSLKLVVGDAQVDILTDNQINVLPISQLDNITDGPVITNKSTTEIGHSGTGTLLESTELTKAIEAKKSEVAAGTVTLAAGKFFGGSRARGGSYKRTQRRRQRKQQRRNGNSKRV